MLGCRLLILAALASAPSGVGGSPARQEELPADGDACCCPAPANAGYSRSEHRYELPDVVLTDAEGRRSALAERLGEGPVLLQFAFTTCATICPVATGTMAAVGRSMCEDAPGLRLVTVSIDPEYDVPARLRAFAEEFGAGPNWSFLTGDPADIARVRSAFDAYTDNKMRHEPLTFLRAGAGRPWVRIDGLCSAEALEREVRHALSGHDG